MYLDDSPPLIRLDLRAPLCYAEAPDLTPFAYRTNPVPGEQLFCFAIDSGQSRSIEPDRGRFLGPLLCAGQSAESGADRGSVTLPAGQYLFAQRREALGREECIDMAIEQQKDGLWERLMPEARLYVRYLFEDGKPVTQLFRPHCAAM